MILVPRPPFEAASSIDRGYRMEGRRILRAGEALQPGLALGTVSSPLVELAAATRNVYGDAMTLLAQHTLYFLLALALLPSAAARLLERLLSGAGRAQQSQLAAWSRIQRCGIRVCPECECQIWKEYGVSAWLWPHLAPFIEACPWHECSLVERCPYPLAPRRRNPTKTARPDKVSFSRALLDLFDGPDRTALTARWTEALSDASFIHPGGRFRAKAFAIAFLAFSANLDIHPALRRLAAFPLRGRDLLLWLSGRDSLNPAYILLLSMFIGHLGTDVAVFGASSRGKSDGPPPRRPAKRAWRAKRRRASPVDSRTPQPISAIEALIAEGCTCADMARLCRTSVDSVYRYIRTHGLRAALEQAQDTRITEEARRVWCTRLRLMPRASANRLAMLEPRAYRWLYRHDIAWLRAHWPEPYRSGRPKKRVDRTGPHGQDAALVARIAEAERQLERDHPAHRRSLAALRRQLGLTEYGLQRVRRWQRVDNAVQRYLSRKPSSPSRRAASFPSRRLK